MCVAFLRRGSARAAAAPGHTARLRARARAPRSASDTAPDIRRRDPPPRAHKKLQPCAKFVGVTGTTLQAKSEHPPSALRGRAPALAGRVTATQCGSGPLGTGAAGGVPPPPPSTKPKPPAHAGSRPSAAESGRAADRELSGVWTEFEALATRHSRPRPSGESVHSERLRGRFTISDCPSCGGTHSPGVGLSGTLLSTYSRVGHSSQPHHICRLSTQPSAVL